MADAKGNTTLHMATRKDCVQVHNDPQYKLRMAADDSTVETSWTSLIDTHKSSSMLNMDVGVCAQVVYMGKQLAKRHLIYHLPRGVISVANNLILGLMHELLLNGSILHCNNFAFDNVKTEYKTVHTLQV